MSAFACNAQTWKHFRNEFGLGVGASNFLGELGGANKEGRDFVQDLEVAMTRPALSVTYRYRFLELASFKTALTYARVNGDDKLTKERYRQNRNLNFRSPIWEASARLEFSFIGEKNGHLYRMSGVDGIKKSSWSAYIFGGVGGFYFKPQGKHPTAGWVDLQPLSTEGQGLKPGTKPYDLFSICIPYGLGLKLNLDKQWSFGFEFGSRKTFTDYIDDVSTVYFDNDALRLAKGDIAAYMADPNLDLIQLPDGIKVTSPGQQRGDPTDNDAYMIGVFSINYKLFRYRYNLPRF